MEWACVFVRRATSSCRNGHERHHGAARVLLSIASRTHFLDATVGDSPERSRRRLGMSSAALSVELSSLPSIEGRQNSKVYFEIGFNKPIPFLEVPLLAMLQLALVALCAGAALSTEVQMEVGHGAADFHFPGGITDEQVRRAPPPPTPSSSRPLHARAPTAARLTCSPRPQSSTASHQTHTCSPSSF